MMVVAFQICRKINILHTFYHMGLTGICGIANGANGNAGRAGVAFFCSTSSQIEYHKSYYSMA